MPEGFSDLLGDLERDLDADLRRLGGTRQKKKDTGDELHFSEMVTVKT